MQESVSVAIAGSVFLIGVVAFLLAKRALSPGRPSAFSAPGQRYVIADALVSALIFLSLFAVSIVWRGQIGAVEQRFAAHTVVEWAIFLSVTAVAIGVQGTSEEIVFRGYVLPRVAGWTAPSIGVLVSAAAFTGLHFGVSLWGYAVIMTIGVAAAISVLFTGNIGAAAGLHVVNNFVGLALSPLNPDAQITAQDARFPIVLVVLWLCCVLLLAPKRRDLLAQRLPAA